MSDDNNKKPEDKNEIVKYIDEFQKNPAKEGAWVGGGAFVGLLVLGLPGLFLGAAAGTKPGRNFLAYCGIKLSEEFGKSSGSSNTKKGPTNNRKKGPGPK